VNDLNHTGYENKYQLIDAFQKRRDKLLSLTLDTQKEIQNKILPTMIDVYSQPFFLRRRTHFSMMSQMDKKDG
jgi:hypothetical protein